MKTSSYHDPYCLMVLFQILILLAVANGAPVAAKLICGRRWSRPVDGNLSFFDHQPLLGSSKTIRGVLVSIVATTALAPLLGLELKIGLMVSATAMAGDLLSSFVKRRLGLTASSRATGVDQIPESLFPLLVCRNALSLSAGDIFAGVAMFFVGEVLLSRVLYKYHLRDRPY